MRSLWVVALASAVLPAQEGFLPAGLSPGLQGMVFEHSYVLVDGGTVTPLFVSNTVSVAPVP